MSWVNLANVVYPIGSYFISNEENSSAEMFGGEWTEVTGRVLYMNAGTSTGGTNSDAHKHWMQWGTYGSESAVYFANGSEGSRVMNSGSNYFGIYNTATAKARGPYRETQTYSPGSTTGNMPAYREVYAWYRIA